RAAQERSRHGQRPDPPGRHVHHRDPPAHRSRDEPHGRRRGREGVTVRPQGCYTDGPRKRAVLFLSGTMAPPKQPPHSIEAEQSVLGGLMLDNRIFYDLADQIGDSDFYRADHQLIYRAIGELISANKPCDFVTLSEHLRNQGKLEEAGGIAYLGSLAVETYSVSNVKHYAEIVRERSVLRSLIAIGADVAEMGYRPEGRTPVQLIEEAEQRVFAIRDRGARSASQYH